MVQEKVIVNRQKQGSGQPLEAGLSIVIPVYNSAQIIPGLVERLRLVAESL